MGNGGFSLIVCRAAACGLILAPAWAAAMQPASVGEPAGPLAVEARPPEPLIAPEANAAGIAGPADPQARSVLPSGTVVYVTLEEDLSTTSAALGQVFRVTVSQDVVAEGTAVIPAGAEGWGEVTFVSRRGGFGKPGIIGISLREMTLGGETFALDGRYREEGKNNGNASAATFFAVGIFAGLIKGGPGDIPRGRELKARTGEDIPFVLDAAPPAVPARGLPEEQTGDPEPQNGAPVPPDEDISAPTTTS